MTDVSKPRRKRENKKVLFGFKGLKLTTPQAMKRLGIAIAASDIQQLALLLVGQCSLARSKAA